MNMNTSTHPEPSHVPQIVAVIVTGVMCFIAGVLSSDAVSLLTASMSAGKLKVAPPSTSGPVGPVEQAAAPVGTALERVESLPASTSTDPIVQRAGQLVVEGNRLLAAGNIADSVKKFIAAGELDPALAPAFNNLAVAYAAMESPLEAADALRQAIDIDPKNEMYQRNLAKIEGGESPAGGHGQ